MSSVRGLGCVAAVLAGLGACAAPDRPPCTAGLGTPMLVFSLFFGETIPGRAALTGKEWRSFLDDTVSVNLPHGYTVLDGNGAWMNPRTGRTGSEPAKVLLVALPDLPASGALVARVRTAYQDRFQQQLVGMTVERACGSF